MSNEQVKQVISEKRRLTIGQLTDLLVSGALRRELGMDKTQFAVLVSVMRSTIRRIEGLEATPRMGLIFNTAAALKIGINFPECGVIEPTKLKDGSNDFAPIAISTTQNNKFRGS